MVKWCEYHILLTLCDQRPEKKKRERKKGGYEYHNLFPNEKNNIKKNYTLPPSVPPSTNTALTANSFTLLCASADCANKTQ